MSERERLPDRRTSWNQKATVHHERGRQTLHFGFGDHPDGRLAEVWIDAAKQGTFLRDALHALAGVVSIGLQYGVPLSEVVDFLKGMECEPRGRVEGVPEVGHCDSVFDLLARLLEAAYLAPAQEESPAGLFGPP